MRVVTLGFGCNNACVFCAQGQLRAGDAPPDDVAPVAPGEIVAFAGGEPTLSDRLIPAIAAADAAGARRVVLQTNGRRLAYRTYARELAATSRRLVLDVSLHGSTEAMHEYHTATPGSFKQTAQGIRNACAEGIAVGVTVVVTRSNFRHLSEIVKVAHALGASALHLAIAEPLGSAARARDRVVPPLELARPHLARAMADARRLGMGVLAGDTATPEDVKDRFAGIGVTEPPAREPTAPRRLDVLR